MSEEQQAEPEPPPVPLAFQLAVALPVAAVLVFFVLRWIRPSPPEG